MIQCILFASLLGLNISNAYYDAHAVRVTLILQIPFTNTEACYLLCWCYASKTKFATVVTIVISLISIYLHNH